jgi:hypothetical protein
MSNKLPKTVFNKVLKEMGFRYRSSSHNFMKSNGETVTVSSDLSGDYVFMNDRIVKIQDPNSLKRVLQD